MDARKTPYSFIPALDRGKRGGAVQHIQDAIRDAIVRLDLAPGEFLDKAALCERLGVSRFPVSEALGRLSDEGFVEVLPQRGTRVTRIDLADCREAMFIRRALESDCARSIAAGADKALIETLRAILRDQDAAMKRDDRAAFHACDLALHDVLMDRLGYERVRVAVSAARAKLDRMRLFMCTPQRQAATYAEHRRIVTALAARDPDAAARAMEVHLDQVMEELSAFAAIHPEAFEADEKRDKDVAAA
jgi:DNA-binding GntR family transcriptional regulator